jgi:predicted HTH transcriptional regulator
VQIQLFPDRLTILNPGGLFGPVTPDRLGEAGIAAACNPVLMKLLEDTLAPEENRLVCENRGSGISAMLAALADAGLAAPRFVDRIVSFEVTFQALVATEENTTGALYGNGTSGGEAGVGCADRRRPLKRADRRRELLGLLRERGELTRSEIAAALGLGDETTRKCLQACPLSTGDS